MDEAQASTGTMDSHMGAIRNAIGGRKQQPATSSVSTERLIGLGLVSSALFSATFLINCMMHLSAGNWIWSASNPGLGI